MQIEAMLKALTYFGVQDVFQIIMMPIVEELSTRLMTIFTCQVNKYHAAEKLSMDPTNVAFGFQLEATDMLNDIGITNSDMLISFQHLDIETICPSKPLLSNVRVDRFGGEHFLEQGWILATCKDGLRNKV